jgi:hypothetical protein
MEILILSFYLLSDYFFIFRRSLEHFALSHSQSMFVSQSERTSVERDRNQVVSVIETNG